MTFDTVSNNNAGGVSVKVEFYGELRRFSTLGASFSSLVQELIAVLDIERGSELLVTYRDDEGDLITMSTDLELKSALVNGGVLRLFVAYKEPQVEAPLQARTQQAPLVDVNMVDAQKTPLVQPSAPSVLYPLLGQPALASQGPAGFPHPFLGPHGGPVAHGGCHRGGPWSFHHGSRGWGHHGWGHGMHGGSRGCCKKYSKCGETPAWMQNHDALVAQIEQLGFDVNQEKISKLLRKFDGNVDEVASLLAWKKEKKERKCCKKEWKSAKKEKADCK